MLDALIARLAVAEETTLVRRQLATALALLEMYLAEGRSPRAAGLRFGAWLGIAIRQSPDLFVDEVEASSRIVGLREDWRFAARGDDGSSRENVERALAECAVGADEMLRVEQNQPVKVLFIGDCLLWDASLQLQIVARENGLLLEPMN